MKLNPSGIRLIKEFESLSLKAYRDQGGIWTIGYGHTGDVEPGLEITREQAEQWFKEDVEFVEENIAALVKVPLTANQHAALVSFIYNVGLGNPGIKAGFQYLVSGNPSTMLRLLNEGKYDSVASEFSKWIHVGGIVSNGLIRRRKAEQELFERYEG